MGIFLSESTWPEVKKYVQRNNMVLIPTGSCEQHGHHTPLGTDYLVVEEIAKRMAQHCDILVCPTIPIGHSSNHERFPGTLTIQPFTYQAFLEDVCRSLLRHGLRKIVFLNGHSGNTPFLQGVCNLLRNERAFGCIVEWWQLVGELLPEHSLSGHGDSLEASAVMAFRPEFVKMNCSKPYKPKLLTNQIRVESWQKLRFGSGHPLTWLKTEDGSKTGNFGSLQNASAEKGEKALSVVVDYMVDLLKEIGKLNLKKLK